MKKNFLKGVLLGAFTFMFAISFVACSDYDDDIKDLQNQLDKKASIEDLTSKVTTLEASIAQAKTDATAAKTTAEEALAKAKEALEAGGGDPAAIEALEKKLQAEIDKLVSLEDVNKKIAELKTELSAGFISEEKLKELRAEVEKVSAKIMSIIGSRLTSIAFIPTENINGIPAIKFVSLSYTPQSFNKAHTEGKETTIDAAKSPLVISSEETTIQYRMNPRTGVKSTDILKPSFDCIVSTNEIDTRAVDAKKAGFNTPIMPVAAGKVLDNGIYELKVKKAFNENINKEWLIDGVTEKFYMASLNVPIAEANRTTAEVEAGTIPTVNSEYVRIAESTRKPFLKQVGSGLPAAGHELYVQDANKKWIHYHDSTVLYKSDLNKLVDHQVKWDATFDLRDLTEVCVDGHETLKNHKDYGLTFRYAIATGKYEKGDNKTDQQQFAEIASNGYDLTSKTYTIGGSAQTAIGREPIIRAVLVDTVNNKLVAQRYIKIQFVGTEAPTQDLPLYDKWDDEYVQCMNTEVRFGTQEMNELIYRQIGEKGMSKTDFHNTYKKLEIIELTKDGKVIDNDKLTTLTGTINSTIGTADYRFSLVPDPLDNTSYNLVWEMTPKAVGTLKDLKSSDFIIKVAFVSDANAKVTKTFKVTVKVPTQSFIHQGIYWQDGAIGKVFKVNPIVYSSENDGPLTIVDANDHATHTLNGYSHIDTDLVNGFLYTDEQKPANLAQFIKYIRSCADVRFEFDKAKFGNYSHLKDYTTNNVQDELWKTTVGTLNPKGQYLQSDNSAATIENIFGATAVENKKNFPWDKDETLGTGDDIATARIRLSETNKLNGTPAAKALVGKKVPVRLVVEYNTYNKVPVQEFDVLFMNPLDVDGKIADMVQDAVIDGDYVDVEKNFTFTDWNKYAVAKTSFTKPTDKQKYAHELWHFYNVQTVVFDTKNAKTNIKLIDGATVPTEGYKEGKLPAGRTLVQKVYNEATGKYDDVSENPTHLGYFNADGTPVNLDYKIYLKVKVTYKWGELEKDDLELGVLRADGNK